LGKVLFSLDEERLLNSLGLTATQAKVYLALVYSGPSKVTEISKNSGIHRAHLYQTLHSLESCGLVERNLSNGVFTPTPLKDALDMLLEQKHKEMEKIEATAKAIAGSPKKESTQKAETPEILLLTNKIQILKKADSFSMSAKETLCLMHSWNRFLQLWENYSITFSDAMARGVKVKQIIECPEDKVQLQSVLRRPVFSNPLFEARLIQKNGGNFTIVDGEKISISTVTEKMVLGQAPMLFSNYKGLLDALKNYFEQTWKNAPSWTEINKQKTSQ
jgi:sugar-specific transcriptional regulator TrmB